MKAAGRGPLMNSLHPNEANVIFEEMRRSNVSEINLGTHNVTVQAVSLAKFARQDQPTRDVTMMMDSWDISHRESREFLANISVIRIPRSKALHHARSAHIF
jgi:carboxylesterase type B